MKVWFFEVSDAPKTGGEIYNRRLYDYLVARGLDVTRISVEPVLANARRRLGPLWRLTPLRRLFIAALCAWRLLHCRGIIVESHTYSREMFLLNLWHKTVLRQPVVAILHHYDYYRSDASRSLSKLLMQLKERLFFLSVDRIITISEFCRREIESVGVATRKIVVLYPGFDAAKQMDTVKLVAKAKVELLFVGTVYERNGLDTLLNAVSRLKVDFHLHLAGSTDKGGQHLESLQHFILSNGLQQRVTFHGRVDDDELDALYQRSDIFVLPARMHGFGIVLLEAMHYALPIVATRVGAIPELVQDGGNGLLVPPDDPEALAAALERLIADEELRRRLGEEGRRRVEGAFSWRETEEGFHELVLALTAKAPAQAARVSSR